MRFLKLLINDKQILNEIQIESVLSENQLWWLIDCEIENAVIEIKKNTLIWHSGDLFAGRWHYGIWKSGMFHGIWENGIFEDGKFSGKFISGIIPQKLLPKK